MTPLVSDLMEAELQDDKRRILEIDVLETAEQENPQANTMQNTSCKIRNPILDCEHRASE